MNIVILSDYLNASTESAASFDTARTLTPLGDRSCRLMMHAIMMMAQLSDTVVEPVVARLGAASAASVGLDLGSQWSNVFINRLTNPKLLAQPINVATLSAMLVNNVRFDWRSIGRLIQRSGGEEVVLHLQLDAYTRLPYSANVCTKLNRILQISYKKTSIVFKFGLRMFCRCRTLPLCRRS